MYILNNQMEAGITKIIREISKIGGECVMEWI